MSGCERVGFDLPWPWGGDRFELRAVRRLIYIIGPLGSGKTRLAFAIAERLPDTSLIGLERLADDGAQAKRRMRSDRALRSRVNQILDCLTAEGGGAELLRAHQPARGTGVRRGEAPCRRYGRTGAGPGHATGAGSASAPARAGVGLALPADSLQRNPRSQSRRPARGDHSLPRQPECAHAGRTASGGARLRVGFHVSGIA